MTIQNPVGGSPEDPYEKQKKYEVGSRGSGNKKFGGEPPRGSLPSGSFFFVLLYKVLDFFLGLGSNSKRKIYGDLCGLRDAFEAMKREDRSQDSEFLNTLSILWKETLEHSLLFKRSDPFSVNFRAFVKKIQNYPEGEDHTLGYYLTEHTREEWLPFPFMEIIQELHEQKDMLALWIQDLNELISHSE